MEVTSAGTSDETHSRVCELEDKVKDLEQKVANLFMDNVALTTKLKASREVERQLQEEVTSLKERLVQALKAQVSIHYCYSLAQCIDGVHSISSCQHYAQETATREQSLSKARELQLEDRIKSLKSLEIEKSDLEATVEKLQKQIMQLEEIHPSDIERLVKVYTFVWPACLWYNMTCAPLHYCYI